MGIIRVRNIECYAYHGCLEEEGRIGQKYLIDVELRLDFSEAAQTDNLSKTIDYCDVNSIVKQEMSVRSKLIEHVGQRILDRFHEEFRTLEAAQIEIKKLNPPIEGNVEYVSVVLSTH